MLETYKLSLLKIQISHNYLHTKYSICDFLKDTSYQ